MIKLLIAITYNNKSMIKVSRLLADLWVTAEAEERERELIHHDDDDEKNDHQKNLLLDKCTERAQITCKHSECPNYTLI